MLEITLDLTPRLETLASHFPPRFSTHKEHSTSLSGVHCSISSPNFQELSQLYFTMKITMPKAKKMSSIEQILKKAKT